MALSWEDSKKYALAGGSEKYGTPEAWQASQNAVPAPPTTSSSSPAPTASWMGSMYTNVPGTDMYSTNPSNPNSAKYKADGTPVPSLVYDARSTGGDYYNGYATPEQMSKINSTLNSPLGAAGASATIADMLRSGQLNQSNDSIFATSTVPAPPSAVASMQYNGGSSTPNVPAPKINPYNEILYSKEQWEGNLGNYGAQAWAENNAKQYYSMLGPEEAAKIQNMNAAELQAYVNSMKAQSGQNLSPVPAPPSSTMSSSTSTPTPISTTGGSTTPTMGGSTPTGYPAMTPQQIKDEVSAKIAAEVLKRTQAANQAKQGIQTSYDRLRTNVGQDRVLQDVTAERNANPFSGRTSYAQGITAMERERTDREQSQDLSTRLANIDVSLQDYINATPEQQRAMENELIRQERDYATQVDQINYQRQRDSKLDAINADERTYKREQDKITNARNAANDQLNARKQHIAEAEYLSEKYGITVEPKEDYQLMLDQVAGLPTAAQRTAAQKQESDQRSEAWKVVEMLGSVPTYLADIIGIPAGTQTQRAKEAAMDNAIKERNANISQQNANTSAKNADTAAKNADTAANKPTEIKGATLESVSKYANSIARYEKGQLVNPDQVEAAILSYDLPESELRKLYATYGLKWG